MKLRFDILPNGRFVTVVKDWLDVLISSGYLDSYSIEFEKRCPKEIKHMDAALSQEYSNLDQIQKLNCVQHVFDDPSNMWSYLKAFNNEKAELFIEKYIAGDIELKGDQAGIDGFSNLINTEQQLQDRPSARF